MFALRNAWMAPFKGLTTHTGVYFEPYFSSHTWIILCTYPSHSTDGREDGNISASHDLNSRQHFQTAAALENTLTPSVYLIMVGLDSTLILSILFYLI